MDTMSIPQRPSLIIWINGYAGVGKLTVAKELATLYRPEDMMLIDNHQLIDPVAARMQRSDPGYYFERQQERRKAFERWVLDADAAYQLIIFTDCQSEGELGRNVSKEYKDVATQSGRQFVPVLLHCDHDENMKRATSAERQASDTTKLTQPDILEKIRKEEVMLTFGLASELILDTTNLSPVDAARRLYEHITSLKTN